MRYPRPSELPWIVLRLGRVHEGRAWGVLWIWLAWEKLVLRLHQVVPARAGALFVFRIVRHRGRPVTLSDGVVICSGARIVELHLDNAQLARLRRQPEFTTWSGVGHLRRDLAALAQRVASGDHGQVEAIKGLSLLGQAGATLGFECHPLPIRFGSRLQHYFMAGLDAVYHPDGLGRLAGRARRRWPVESWMSAARLVGRYGTPARIGSE